MNQSTEVKARPHSSLHATIGMSVLATAILLLGGLFLFEMNTSTWIIFGGLMVALWIGVVYLQMTHKKSSKPDESTE